VLRQKWLRGQVEARFANLPTCRIGISLKRAPISGLSIQIRHRLLGSGARLARASQLALVFGLGPAIATFVCIVAFISNFSMLTDQKYRQLLHNKSPKAKELA
jgi:hypothetical protein